ncbi:type II toxin-antitoxin system Phd/YefM family antitoxin [Streptomyces sp. Inha503]|uniref:type II toxin-antitoxin system Phd/YefM family antitoxin n=1 Tax=Streptomyces sp. Inha503 TaxID=3383314 RepID=UPI0039A2C2E6
MSESDEVRMGVSDARANLTEVIAKVRLLGQRVVLTRREKPQAVIVSADYYEEAERDRAYMRTLAKLPDEERLELLKQVAPYITKS